MSWVYTKLVLDKDDNVVVNEGFDYDGPIDSCKDHGQDVANQQRQDQLDLQKKAYDDQRAQLDSLNKAFSPYTTGNIGFDPQQLALLQSQFLNQNDQAYSSAGNQVRSSLLARGAGGGDQPIGGTGVQGLLGLQSAKAGNQAAGLQDIGLQNLTQALNNKFNAGSILSGNAATLNSPISTFGGGASSALGSYVQAKSIPGFGGALATSLGTTLGKSLGGANASPAGGFFGLGG